MRQLSMLTTNLSAKLVLPPAGTQQFDFHTHNLNAPAGQALICLPDEWIINPQQSQLRLGALYSAGIHPWLTNQTDLCRKALSNLHKWLEHPQVVAVGECGLDSLRGAELNQQTDILLTQLKWAEQFNLPVVIHTVRTIDRLLHLHKTLKPSVTWTIHGFRAGPATARQLLAAGFELSFGKHYHPESFELTPPNKRRTETDAPNPQGITLTSPTDYNQTK